MSNPYYQGEIIQGELSSQKSQLENQIKELQQQLKELKDYQEYLQYLTIRKFQQEFNMTLNSIFKSVEQQKQSLFIETIFVYSLTKFTEKIIKQQISIPRNNEIQERCVYCDLQLQNSFIEQAENQDFIRLTCRHFIHLQCLKKSVLINLQQQYPPLQCLCKTSINPFALFLIKDIQLAKQLEQYQYQKLGQLL